MALCLAATQARSEPHNPYDPLAGAASDISRRLSTAYTVHWQGVSLRQSVDRLRELEELNIWVDRRLDPSTKLVIRLNDEPATKLFSQLAEQVDGQWLVVGRLIYVGPEPNVRELRTLLALAEDDTDRLSDSARTRMLERRALEVPRLSEPRELVRQIASRGGVRVVNLSEAPHDVWPGMQLSPMAPAAQLALVLQGFDLTWRPTSNADEIEIIPIERPVVLRRSYSQRLVSRLGSRVDDKALEPGPDASQVWFTGRLEDHDLLTSLKNPKPKSARAARPQRGRRVYSLRVHQQPVGKVVNQLSQQLGMKLIVDSQVDSRNLLEKRVSFDVREADLSELLTAACEPAGISVVVQQDTIRLSELAAP